MKRRDSPAARARREASGIGPRAWRIILINGQCHVGSGLTLPFVLVYLHRARGIGFGTVGLVLATVGLAGLACTPLVGWLTDRCGAGLALVVALITACCGTACFAAASDAAIAFLAAAIFGAGVGSMWSAMNSLLAEAVPGNRYVRVFSFNNAVASIGIGIGAAIGGLFLGGTSPQAYEIMFLIDAVTFGIFAIVLAITGEVSRPKDVPGTGEPGPVDENRTGTGWLAVLSDRRLVLITALNALLVTVMFSQLTVAFPAWSVGPAHSSAGVVGAAFAVNAVLVAGLQPVLIGRIELMTRTTAAAAAALLFACCWLVALTAPYGHGGLLTAVALIAALVLAALGEILLAPSLSALVNGLATDTLRGRYNALFNLAWQVGPIVGPAIAGLLIGHGMSRLLLVGLSAACVLAAGYAWALRAVLPPAVNGAR